MRSWLRPVMTVAASAVVGVLGVARHIDPTVVAVTCLMVTGAVLWTRWKRASGHRSGRRWHRRD